MEVPGTSRGDVHTETSLGASLLGRSEGGRRSINTSRTHSPTDINYSVPSAPELEPDPDEHEIPTNTTLTEISNGPPRYHSLFTSGYVPVQSHE